MDIGQHCVEVSVRGTAVLRAERETPCGRAHHVNPRLLDSPGHLFNLHPFITTNRHDQWDSCNEI